MWPGCQAAVACLPAAGPQGFVVGLAVGFHWGSCRCCSGETCQDGFAAWLVHPVAVIGNSALQKKQALALPEARQFALELDLMTEVH